MSLVNLATIANTPVANMNFAAATDSKSGTDKKKKTVKRVPFGTDDEIYAISNNKAACIQIEGDDIKKDRNNLDKSL